ncbi:serine/threonine protein kinase [Funiculus sociatus GB2-A5]|uniref:non-specific serine/threonine protein kinase n=1 Tax=Funiculus sociatus GB2-A5 TaxID=2933946 RepID=A0ABV0JW67_9CYAN|nr:MULTISPECIES: serine/threonine-protein kinase [unclassified Trichocoleus]MBD1905300.1 serine/threonine protein kinase [Trichocoleus sp. FACHB-832]MBD2065468.1 serine/threonine protein kinase [Trichocoleus sp. FACHB-6]
MPIDAPLPVGSVLENRYCVVRELGQGGFGRTYLVEDTNRYSEHCVLKEFLPQVQGSKELQKAEELFMREAGVLYQLQHPQIPRFRELIRVNLGGTESLFLVQEYVEGQTYCDLLKAGKPFDEAQVIQLLRQILPVLDYIHSLGVVHRDISPDNLIQRSSDKLPVLIDFGGVKQVAVNAASQFTGQMPATRLGKEGYAPEEQIRQGNAFPCSDLYALAVTVLVLLTGKDPQKLFDSFQATWRWRQEARVSPMLAMILDKMLAYYPGDRYQSAREVLQALPSGNPLFSQVPTMNVVGSPAYPIPPTTITHKSKSPSVSIPNPIHKLTWLKLWKTGISASLILAVGVGAWSLIKSRLSSFPPAISSPLPADGSLSKKEQDFVAEITKRRQALKISETVFIRQVDEIFYQKYPELKQRTLTTKPEDARFRIDWYQIADDELNKLEKGAQL